MTVDDVLCLVGRFVVHVFRERLFQPRRPPGPHLQRLCDLDRGTERAVQCETGQTLARDPEALQCPESSDALREGSPRGCV